MSFDRLRPGVRFARDFEIVQKLSEGGMGAVFVAHQLSTGRPRALKVMLPQLVGDEANRALFAREARVGASIHSEHVVEVVAAGVDDDSGMPWLAMELLRGETLAEAVTRRGAMGFASARELLEQAGHALEAAHARGVVHRDLKPENVFLAVARTKGVPFTTKILDFGIAKVIAENRTAATATRAMGSPLWMAPEQAESGSELRPSTDVWSLGLLAFYVLTGKVFWQTAHAPSASLPAVMKEVLFAPIPLPSERARDLGLQVERLPTDFDDWFSACVTRDPEERFAGAGPAIQSLVRLLGQGREGAPSEPPGAWVLREEDYPDHVRDLAPSVPAGAVMAATVPASGVASLPPAPVDLAGGVSFEGSSAPPPRRWGAFAVGAVALLAAAVVWRWPRADDLDDGAVAASAIGDVLPTSGARPPTVSPRAAPPSGCPSGTARIEGATYEMGSAATDSAEDQRPAHRVTVETFCLDRTEVTARDYTACVRNGSCSPAGNGDLCTGADPEKADHPINCVSWHQAREYCASVGARLPREEEWELAARGQEGRVYPWGNQPPSSRLLNACDRGCREAAIGRGLRWRAMFDEDDGFAHTSPVGRFPEGATPQGVLDLGGNVLEWTENVYASYGVGVVLPVGDEDGRARVLRGGHFDDMDPDVVETRYRWHFTPGSNGNYLGFRCARSVASPQGR